MATINTTTAYASRQATVSTTAISLVTFGFTQEQVDQAEKCTISIFQNNLNIDWSGNTPTTSVGHVVEATTEHVILGNQNIKQIMLIRNGGADVTPFITLEK